VSGQQSRQHGDIGTHPFVHAVSPVQPSAHGDGTDARIDRQLGSHGVWIKMAP